MSEKDKKERICEKETRKMVKMQTKRGEERENEERKGNQLMESRCRGAPVDGG